MIESVIINTLKADTILKTKLTLYSGEPAVFSELAPEAAKLPYITININRSQVSGDLVLHDFVLMIDYWGFDTTRVKAREANERIEYLLDNKQFTHARYSSIRIWFFSGGWVEEDDPRAIHYNQQFMMRACRKKWINNL